MNARRGTRHAFVQRMPGATARRSTHRETSRSSPGRSGNGKVKYVIAAFVVAGLVLAVLWLWSQTAEQRAIRHLPAPERKALYERTLSTLRSPCGSWQRSNGLAEFCRDQARFVLEFPECDTACEVLAREYLNTPSK